MKKMNFFIRSVSYFSLILFFILAVNFGVNAQSKKPTDFKLSNPKLVFKSSTEAIATLESKLQSTEANANLESNDGYLLNERNNLYKDLVLELKKGKDVKSTSVQLFESYKNKFLVQGKNYASRFEIMLVRDITKQ